MATLCTEVCSCSRRLYHQKGSSFGKVMDESSLTIEHDESESVNSSTAYLGSTYGACKLYNCLAGTSKAVIDTDTDVLTEDIEQQLWALLEEDYLSPIEEMAVDCDRRCAKWRKRLTRVLAGTVRC